MFDTVKINIGKKVYSSLFAILPARVQLRPDFKRTGAAVWQARIQRGGGGARDPDALESYKNLGFHSNTDPDPLENHKATKPAIIGPPAKRHLNGAALTDRCWPAFIGIYLNPLSLYRLKPQERNKNIQKVELDPL